LELQAGDLFGPIPAGADAYILKDTIHNWPDDRVLRLYENIHRYMNPGSALLVVEAVILDDAPLRRTRLRLDVDMLVIHDGRARTEEEHRRLLAESGFELTRIVPTRSLLSVVEAQQA
jgi:hypothetical protein